MTAILVDAGPMVALLSARDEHHRWACEMFASARPPLLTCEAALVEAAHLVRAGSGGARLLIGLLVSGAIEVRFDIQKEASAVDSLLERYKSVPMSLADACLVRMSELHAASALMTIDREFRIYRRFGRQAIPLLTLD